MFESVFVGALISLLLGGLIGAQREIRQQKEKTIDFAGFRTYTLISLLGFLLGFLAKEQFNSEYIILIGIFGVFALSTVAYRTVSKMNVRKVSIISEVSAIITFILGILVSFGHYHFSISLALFVTIILFLGNEFHKFTKSLTTTEIFASLKFAIISLVVLPFLPNKNFTLLEIPIVKDLFLAQSLISVEVLNQLNVFNPYNTWLMVVFISGIAYVGYLLMRTIGARKGMMLTGFLGGLMSSTALTSSFSIESKHLKYLASPLAVGTIIACSTMFFRILFEVAILNSQLLTYLILPFCVMGTVGLLGAYYIFKKAKINHVNKVKVVSPFTLIPALKFAFFFVFVIFLSKLFTILFGESGIYVVAFFSGVADVDAITISLSNLAATGAISNITAQVGIILAAFSNTFVKGGIAYYLGSREYSKKVLIVFSALVLIGVLTLLFF